MSDESFIRYKRLVAERCIHGVDRNPMAVELAKLSLWLFTMDKGRPLSFLNHHLKCGNSLLGARIEEVADVPNLQSRRGPRQGNLFEQQFKAKIPLMIRDLFDIMGRETLTPQDIRTKKTLDQASSMVHFCGSSPLSSQ